MGSREEDVPRGGFRRALLWIFTWAMLFLSLALGVCAQFPRGTRLGMCHRLQKWVLLVVQSVDKFFSG